MKINILFPTIMKMEFRTAIDIEEPATLDKVKEKIFEVFWKIMNPLNSFVKHSHPSQVILKDLSGKEVLDNGDLEKKLHESNCFEVVFKEHPLTKSIAI